MRLRWTRSDRSERGAIVPMVAMLLVVLIPSSAMAVDLGMQRVVRQDMQSLADVVALDLVRLVAGRSAADITTGSNGQPSLSTALAASVARNADVLGDPPTVTVKLAHMTMATGVLDRDASGATRQVSGAEVPNAIEVTASGAVNFSFVPGKGAATRTSVAVPAPSTCFRLGSYAAGVDLDQSKLLNVLLPKLINSSTFSTTLLGYHGLANANVSLLDLVGVSSLNVATPDQLLNLGGLTLGQFYAATASALQAQGGHAAEVTLLQTLSATANVSNRINVRDILNIATGSSAALAANFNVLDLVVGAAEAANGSSALDVPGLNVLLPGLLSVTFSLRVGAQPKLACGGKGTVASTGQLDLNLAANVDTTLSTTPAPTAPVSVGPLGGLLSALGGLLGGILNGVVSGVLSGNLTATAGVTSAVHLAQATGTLTNIQCGAATSAATAEGIDVAVAASTLSSISATQTVKISGNLDLKVGTVKVATVAVDVSSAATTTSTQGTSTSPLTFRHPNDQYGVAKSTGSGIVLNGLAAPTVDPTATVTITFLPGYGTSGTVSISALGLGATLNALLGTVTSTVNSTLITPLNTLITPQLAKMAGVQVGGASLFALPRPSCQDPALAG